MTTALVTNGASKMDPKAMEALLIGGDLAGLNEKQRSDYYLSVCSSLGLNPLTKPFEYLRLNGKMLLYARKDCTEQLRNLHGVSITIAAREETAGCYVVTARAQDKHGRVDESIGAVPIESLKGEARANALMKAETKAKRRVTLSISGLGMLDESEVDSIPSAQRQERAPAPQPMPVQEAKPVATVPHNAQTGEVTDVEHEPVPFDPETALASKATIGLIRVLQREVGLDDAGLKKLMIDTTGCLSSTKLKQTQANRLVGALQAMQLAPEPGSDG